MVESKSNSTFQPRGYDLDIELIEGVCDKHVINETILTKLNDRASERMNMNSLSHFLQTLVSPDNVTKYGKDMIPNKTIIGNHAIIIYSLTTTMANDMVVEQLSGPSFKFPYGSARNLSGICDEVFNFYQPKYPEYKNYTTSK